MRALRVDKLTYAALEGTLPDYLSGRSADTIPVVRMLTMPVETIERRARAVIDAVGHLKRFEMTLADGVSMVGGGGAPGVAIPTRVLMLRPIGCDAATLEAALRSGTPPVVGRVDQEFVLLDLRTVLPAEDELLGGALRSVGAG